MAKDDDIGVLLLDLEPREEGSSSEIPGILASSMTEVRGYRIGPTGTALGLGGMRAPRAPTETGAEDSEHTRATFARVQQMLERLDSPAGSGGPIGNGGLSPAITMRTADAEALPRRGLEPGPAALAPSTPGEFDPGDEPKTDGRRVVPTMVAHPIETGAAREEVEQGPTEAPSLRDTIEDDGAAIAQATGVRGAPQNDTDPASPSARDARADAQRAATSLPATPEDRHGDARRLARAEPEPAEEPKTDGRRAVPTMVVPTVPPAPRRKRTPWMVLAAATAAIGVGVWIVAIHGDGRTGADEATAPEATATVAPAVTSAARVVASATSAVRAAVPPPIGSSEPTAAQTAVAASVPRPNRPVRTAPHTAPMASAPAVAPTAIPEPEDPDFPNRMRIKK